MVMRLGRKTGLIWILIISGKHIIWKFCASVVNHVSIHMQSWRKIWFPTRVIQFEVLLKCNRSRKKRLDITSTVLSLYKEFWTNEIEITGINWVGRGPSETMVGRSGNTQKSFWYKAKSCAGVFFLSKASVAFFDEKKKYGSIFTFCFHFLLKLSIDK